MQLEAHCCWQHCHRCSDDGDVWSRSALGDRFFVGNYSHTNGRTGMRISVGRRADREIGSHMKKREKNGDEKEKRKQKRERERKERKVIKNGETTYKGTTKKRR